MPEPRTFRDEPVSFVRRSGRMSEAQERAFDELAPHFLIDVPRGVAWTSVDPNARMDPSAEYGRGARLIVEIGSGQGHAIVSAASARPDDDFLAVEVFRAGLARTMLDADKAGVRNLRLIEANAPEVLSPYLPEGAASEVWIFFSDPWHKKRHTKRRLIRAGFGDVVGRALADDGLLRLATDWEDYALQMREVLDAEPLFERAFEGEWAERFDGRIMTAFERKGIAQGREIRDLVYRREVLGVTRTETAWTPAVVPAALVCLAAPAFFVIEWAWLGWVLLAVGVAAAWFIERGAVTASAPSLTRDLSLIALGMLIVSVIPLAAELDNLAMLRFTLALGGAVAVPYLISRFVFRDRAISFPWRTGKRWDRLQWTWLIAVLVLGWLILPFYFITSGVYQNWPVVDTPDLIARLFVGVEAVGIWDELFFICTVFALLRRHFPNALANVLQAIVFVSFLWELGYREWGPVLTIPFALLQGYIFLRTHSLAYVVTVHLLFDAVVFAVLVHAHNPGLLPIFLV